MERFWLAVVIASFLAVGCASSPETRTTRREKMDAEDADISQLVSELVNRRIEYQGLQVAYVPGSKQLADALDEIQVAESRIAKFGIDETILRERVAVELALAYVRLRIEKAGLEVQWLPGHPDLVKSEAKLEWVSPEWKKTRQGLSKEAIEHVRGSVDRELLKVFRDLTDEYIRLRRKYLRTYPGCRKIARMIAEWVIVSDSLTDIF